MMIFNSENDIIFLMMSCMFSLFYLQALEKLDSGVFNFWLFSELAIWTGILPGVLNTQEILYVRIFIGIFVVNWYVK